MDVSVLAPSLDAVINALVTFAIEFVSLIKENNQTVNVEIQSHTYFCPDCEQKCKECVVVLYSNTIIYPWAVMIKSFNTLIADSAVPASR